MSKPSIPGIIISSKIRSILRPPSWELAFQYLSNVEKDARLATNAAGEAVEEMTTALASIERAISLERFYREPVTWKPLWDEITTLADSV